MWNRISARRAMVRTAALYLAAILLAAPAISQSFYGSLIGVVRDAQGGVIPGASILVVNVGTNERHEAVSAEDGSYRFVNLVPGTYRIEAELQGFQRYVQDKIEVNVQAAVRRDVVLQLGNIAETIQVVGEAALLQTENAAVGLVVNSRPVQELPLNGRNVLNLIALAPSVVPQGSSEGSLTGKNVFAAGNYQIGGGTANQSAALFDGVPVQDIGYGNIVVLTPSPESVAEFRVQTNNSSAEFGRFTGGVVNMASRSGTSSFHGSLFEYNRNKALNSNTFFGKRSGLDKPPFVQNNFGGSMGGPIRKDKLFFFSNYEGYRNREGVLFRRTVPTAAMVNGDFSDYRNLTTGALVPMYDPWTQCGITNPGTGAYNGDCGVVPNRLQFPGNVIQANRISPIARKLLGFPIYAAPTVADQWRNNNFERNLATGGDNNQFTIRSDYNMTDRQRLLGRYTIFESRNLPVDVYGNGQLQGDPYSPEHFITTQVMAAHTYTLSSKTVLDMRFGFLRWHYDRTPGNLGIDLVGKFGLPKTPYGEISQRSGIPGMETIPSITNNQTFIGTGLLYGDDRTYSFTPTLTRLTGGHTLKFGANIMRAEVNYFQNNNTGGTLTFSNAPTALDGTNPGSTGDAFASFLLGLPTGGTYQSSGFTYSRTLYQAYFADDSWQVNSRFTLNLGLRWEIPGVYTEKADNLSDFNPNAVNPLLKGITNPVTGQPFTGAVELVNSPEQPDRGLRREMFHLFAPRVGVAYRLTDKTVLRGGGGTFIVPSTARFQDGATGNGINNRTSNIVTSVDANRTFFTDLSNTFPNGVENYPGRDPRYQQALLGGGSSAFIHNEGGYPGSTHQWNAAVQHQFRGDVSVEVAYIGLRGNHQPNTVNMNQLPQEYVDRAANDPTVCSLTNNVIIPEGQPGYTSSQRDTCYGAYLRQLVSNPFLGLIKEGSLSTSTIQRALLLVPFPEYTSANRPGYAGSSRYNALQLRADKRFGGGGVLSANYTFSREYTNVETLTTWLESGGSPVAGYQTTDLSKEWALSSHDVRQRAVINYVVDLPFGEGHRFLSGSTGLLNNLVSGWTLNGVSIFQLGFPLGFTATPNLIGNGFNLRPNVDPNCNKEVKGSAVDRLNAWFNTACFSVPNAGFVAADPATKPGLRWNLGNEPRTDSVLRAQGINNWNLAISKSTRISNGVTLTLRAEAFNIFNRTQFAPPNTQASTAANNTFGQVTTQVNQPRLMQLAFRLTF